MPLPSEAAGNLGEVLEKMKALKLLTACAKLILSECQISAKVSYRKIMKLRGFIDTTGQNQTKQKEMICVMKTTRDTFNTILFFGYLLLQ